MSTLQCGNIHFESTANNRIQYTGTNTFVFVAAGSNVMSVNTSGINFTNTTLTGSNLSLSTNTFTVGTASYFVANGNVGIGTSSPSQKLHVSGNYYLTGDGYFGASNNMLYETGGSFVVRSAANLSFYTSGANERMRIDSSGNVGIGTSSAVNKLTIQPPDNGGFTFVQNAVNQTAYVNWRDSDGTDSGRISYDHATDAMRFTTNATERMRIETSGNVAIGNTSTSGTGRLHVENNGTNYVWARNSAAGAGLSGFVCQNSGDTRGMRINGSNLEFYDFSNSVTRAYIDSTGRVIRSSVQPYGMSVYSTGGLGRGNFIVFNSITQGGTDYSTSTGRMTAPVTGTYLLNCTIKTSGSQGLYFTVSVVINGSFVTDYFGYDTSNAKPYGGTTSTVYRLNSGDYVQYYWNHDTAGSTLNYAWFSYYLLG